MSLLYYDEVSDGKDGITHINDVYPPFQTT